MGKGKILWPPQGSSLWQWVYFFPDLWNWPRVHCSQLSSAPQTPRWKAQPEQPTGGRLFLVEYNRLLSVTHAVFLPPALLWTIPNYGTSQWEGLFRMTFLAFFQISAFLIYLFKGPGNLRHRQHWCEEQIVLGSRFWSSTYCMWCDLRQVMSSL